MVKLGVIVTAATITVLTAEFLSRRTSPFPAYGWMGLVALLCAEWLMFRGVQPVATYFTPIAWTAYILIACIECYRRYPEMMREITGATSPEALGAAGRSPGSQIDAVHLWSIANFPLLGRQVLAPFGLVDLERDLPALGTVLDFWRRAAGAFRADGELQAWDAGLRVPRYGPDVVDTLARQMRQVYSRREEALRRGTAAAERVRAGFDRQVRPVAAADLQADVLTDLGRVLGMAVGGDDDDAVQLELRVHDAVALSRGHGPAVLVGGDHLELAPEDFVVVLHGFASLALEVDVRGEICLGHVGSPLDGMLGGMGAASTMDDRSQRANVTAAKMSTWRNPLEVALVGPVGHTAASASWV